MDRNEAIKIALSNIKEWKRHMGTMIFDEAKFKVDRYAFHAIKYENSNEFSLYIDGEYVKLASDGTLCRNNGCCLSGCGYCL